MAFVDEEMINIVSRFPFKPRFRVEIKYSKSKKKKLKLSYNF